MRPCAGHHLAVAVSAVLLLAGSVWSQATAVNQCTPSVAAPQEWPRVRWHEFAFRLPAGFVEQDLSNVEVYDRFDWRQWRRGRVQLEIEEGYITGPLAEDFTVMVTSQCTRTIGGETAIYEIAQRRGSNGSWVVRLTIARRPEYRIALSGEASSAVDRDLLWSVLHSFQRQ